MSKLFKTALLAIAATAILSGPLQAGNGLKNVSLSAKPIGKIPSLTFEHSDGKWKLGKAGPQADIKFRLKAEKKSVYRITGWSLRNSDIEAKVTRTSGLWVKKLDKTVTHKIRSRELEPFISMGRSVCEQEGSPDKVFKKKTLPRPEFYLRVTSRHSIFNEYADVKIVKKKVPLQIICLPEPLKVKNIDVKVKYEKLPGKCKVKAHLQAVIKTNKKSKQNVSFWYYRDNGDRQQVTVKTQNSGIAYFNKHYTFKKSESRKYLINVGGDHPYQTKWTAVKVNCAGSGSDGFQTAPKPNTH